MTRVTLANRFVFGSLCAVLSCGLSAPVVLAQEAETQAPASATGPGPTTRVELIDLARREKHATLWPEREHPLVVRANRLVDRGFIEGIQSGEGNNGWQLLLTGTRPAQGQTFGIGYRRSDLFNDALTARGTVREEVAEGAKRRLHVDVWCEKPDGTKATVGTATVLQ